MSDLRPRLCQLDKAPTGYGFHLHGEKGKSGQFIRLVEPDSPAEAAGLRAGDRLVFVNGSSVEGEAHQQVVSRIRASSGTLQLIVVDQDTSDLLQRLNLQCRKEFVEEGIPQGGGGAEEEVHSNGTPRESSPAPGEDGDDGSVRSERLSVSSSNKEEQAGPRPRLCHMQKGASGYGFNLHSDKSRPGQFIRAVDDDSPAQRAGLRPQDRIVQVNGLSVLGKQHSEVVAAIKAGGDETTLLVVDAEADDFFQRCNVLPGQEHVTGPLPEPLSERPSEEAEVRVQSESKSKEDVNSTSPSVTPTAEEPAGGLGLGLSLAQAKERARQNRAGKKAPSMDWSKRNELFSNL